MQKKSENFLERMIKKDYNNNLEKVLSKKDFSEEVKNTLLSLFYKIENGYQDYSTVKRETFDKKEYIGKLINIIEKDCEKIEFINQKDQKKEKVDKEKKEIICLPIEHKILYALAKIQKRNVVVKYLDESIEESFSFMLNIGNNMNIVEPLRDFNGFSWNTIQKDIEDLNYNLIYQNIVYLVGNQFVDKWVNDYEPLVDYFDLFQNNLQKRYGKEIKDTMIYYFIILSLKQKGYYEEEFYLEIQKKKEKLEEDKIQLENKEFYLANLVKKKKEKEKEVKILDKIMNDKKLLIQEYERRNQNLPLEKKVFSIRVLKNKLKEERDGILKEINQCNKWMNPKAFLEKRNEVEKKLKYFREVENSEIKEDLMELQKEIIKCMYMDVKRAEDKSTLIKLIYQYRYYSLLPIENNKTLREEKELEKSFQKLSKTLIQKAIEMKVINPIAEKEEINFNIIEKLWLLKIITLQDISIKLIAGKDNIEMVIYDEETEENRIKLENITKDDIKIKFDKKIRLFI